MALQWYTIGVETSSEVMMPNPNQSNLPVSKREREVLDLARERFERDHGKGDWGDFLAALAAGFLVGAGVAAVVRAVQNRENAWWVICPHCQGELRVVASGRPPSAEVMQCPYCGQDVIVSYRT